MGRRRVAADAAGGTRRRDRVWSVARCEPVRRILRARTLLDVDDRLIAAALLANLLALGFGAAEVGAVATTALLGSSLIPLAMGVAGTRADPRLLLLLAAALMAAAGFGFTMVPRGLAAAAGPALAAAAPAAGHREWQFVACGVLKFLYDGAPLAGFRRARPPAGQ